MRKRLPRYTVKRWPGSSPNAAGRGGSMPGYVVWNEAGTAEADSDGEWLWADRESAVEFRRELRDRDRASALRTGCPECGAMPGDPCKQPTASGRHTARKTIHTARIRGGAGLSDPLPA